jgi:hypothetical protein
MRPILTALCSTPFLTLAPAAVAILHAEETAGPHPAASQLAFLERLYLERIDDPPASARTLSLRSESPAGVIVYGPYVSVQVNVNAAGNNIVGDAANEPSMAIDRNNPNRIAIGWRQFDSVSSNFRQAGYGFSTDGGQSWTFPGVLDPGVFRSDPVLTSDAAGNFYYSSLTADQDLWVHVFKSTDGGATWPTFRFAYGGDKQWIVADQRSSGVGAGSLYQYWSYNASCCGTTDFTRGVAGGASFLGPYSMPSPHAPLGTLATGVDGTVYVVGFASPGHGFTLSRNAKDFSQSPRFDPVKSINLGGSFAGGSSPNPGGLSGQPWIAAHQTVMGRLYVLSTVNPPTSDPADVMFIRSTNEGVSWSAPVRVNDDPIGTNAWQWFGAMSVAPNGRIDATWNDTRVSGVTNLSAVFYSFSLDEGQTWSPNVQITPTFDSHVGFPNQDKIGDYTHMISDDDGASLAFAATFNGEQDVYFIRIPLDCNLNGVTDACDASCGPPGSDCDVPGCGESPDGNGNGRPDECEPGIDAASPDPQAVVSNRFISFVVQSQRAQSSAIRVRLESLHHPSYPLDAPDFSSFEGQYRYVNLFRNQQNDPILHCDDSFPDPSFACAYLGCEPEYRNWAEDLEGEVLRVTGDAVVPSSTYVIAMVPPGCVEPETNCPDILFELPVVTSTWGDLLPGELDVVDLAAAVNKLKSLAGWPPEYRTLMGPQSPDPMERDASITDVSAIVDALKEMAYPFAIQACP